MPTQSELRLRVLATSDMHMQMTSFDYVRNRQNAGGSLAKLATLIAAQRADAQEKGHSCLLFDNGDTFQGSPVSDVLAQGGVEGPHPITAMLNALSYDAVGLGNHDCDYGLEYLGRCLADLDMPVVCSNMVTACLPMIHRTCLLEREMTASDQTPCRLRIGVVSSMPEKTALWSRFHLKDCAYFDAALPALRKAAAALRSEGADLVIALAHMGIATVDEGLQPQNLIHEVADLDDIDVVIGGHTHLRFPSPDHDGIDDVDVAAGTVRGTPVVQPGPSGSDLGVVDLTLARSSPTAPWTVTAHAVSLEPVGPDTQESEMAALTKAAHTATRRYLSKRVAAIAHPVHSFFALADPSVLPALLAEAKRLAIREATAGTADAELPLLAAATVPMTGGLDGPDNFLLLDPGPIERRHIAGMNPYANNVWAVKTTGAHLIEWLERSAMIFNQLDPQTPDQALIDPRVPGFRCDAIYGLTYCIDPRQPARFDVAGRERDVKGRVTDIKWQGAPLDPAQTFLVATTDHRAMGGGFYKPFSDEDIILQGAAPMQDAVLHYFESAARSHLPPDYEKPWHFVPDMGCSAILFTSPHAVDHLEDIDHLSPETVGVTEDGFLRLRLHL